MTNGNQLAFPANYEEEYGDNGRKQLITHNGLTKREYFAAMATIDFGDWTMDTICQALKIEKPDFTKISTSESFLFWVNAEAKLKIIKAEALILELNKPQS